MQKCEQAPGLNMLQHGKMVYAEYNHLISELELGIGEPTLLKVYQQYKSNLPPAQILKRYMWLHDCGKSLCLEIGEDGKRRFPGHADASAEQFLLVFPEQRFIAELIRRDMDFHILRGDDLLRLCKHPFAPILYLTAWAELEANSKIFGGKTSDSYKIKRKRLIQAGKILIKN